MLDALGGDFGQRFVHFTIEGNTQLDINPTAGKTCQQWLLLFGPGGAVAPRVPQSSVGDLSKPGSPFPRLRVPAQMIWALDCQERPQAQAPGSAPLEGSERGVRRTRSWRRGYRSLASQVHSLERPFIP